MKFLAFAAVASALVLPDASVVEQVALADHKVAGAVKAAVHTSVDAIDSWVHDGLEAFARVASVHADTAAELDDVSPASSDVPVFDPVGKGKRSSNLTLYQLISSSNYTTKFASLVDQFPVLVDMLNSTAPLSENHTLFVPLDTAFAKLPGGALNESDSALVESVVRYHIGLGNFPYKVLFATHTVPSAYDEPLLGGEPQRLRVRFEKALGVRVNFYARIIAPNFSGVNGVIHAVDSVIVPPSFVGRQLSLVPAEYSTLMLAMQQSNFTEFIHSQVLNGSTVLAPSNMAFVRLGPEINAFLFNTPRGLQCLNALLRYSIVPNATVYSDAYYGAALPGEGVSPPFAPIERLHYQLPTLLSNATVSVNVTTVPGYSVMSVNNRVRVTVQDGVAKNGVIQEVSEIALPPLVDTPWVDPPVRTVAELVARLAPYVDFDESDDVPEVAPAAITEL